MMNIIIVRKRTTCFFLPVFHLDELLQRRFSNHVVILHKGRYFKLTAYHRGTLLKPKDIERYWHLIFLEFIFGKDVPTTGATETVAMVTKKAKMV